jgi:hypothetical protein
MNSETMPLRQYTGQQAGQSDGASRHPYKLALERKRKRQQAKLAMKEQEANILPIAPAQTQPFSNFLAGNRPGQYPAQPVYQPSNGTLPWAAVTGARK